MQQAVGQARYVLDVAELMKRVDEARAALMNALKALIAGLEASSSTDDECADFANLISASQRLLDLDDLEMSRLVKVSRPTISRWSRGLTSPHPIARNAIFRVLLKRAQQKAKSLQD